MCSNPYTLQTGEVIACRTCGACIAARKDTWVARAMAEKATSPNTYALTLTYRDGPEGPPDGAKAFRYRDVQLWLKSLREEIARQHGQQSPIRYIIAGERGSQNKRVHWHCILFSAVDLATVGTYTDLGGNPEPFTLKRRQLWSHWEHGLIEAQEPGEAGIAYVMKYILKDYFGAVKAKGTMREAKAEQTAASYFRMSRFPPIGTDYLVQKIREYRDAGQLPVTLKIQVPGKSGYWHPTGVQRELLLQSLWAINQEVKHRTGRNAPQFATLLNHAGLSGKKGEEGKDFETLRYGVTDEQSQPEQDEQFRDRQHRAERIARARERRARCGGPRVCAQCWRGKSDQQREQVRAHIQDAREQFARASSKRTFEGWYRQTFKGNPHCGDQGPGWSDAFPA